MRISIDVDETYPDIEIKIGCRHLTPEIEKMMAILRMLDMQLTVRKENTTFFLDLSKVLYIEAVERNTFVYTDEGVYESEMKLYELQIMVSRMYADELRKRLGVKLEKRKRLFSIIWGRFSCFMV